MFNLVFSTSRCTSGCVR